MTNRTHYYLRRPDPRAPGGYEYLCWDGHAGAFIEWPSTKLAFCFTEAEARAQNAGGRYEEAPI